MSYSTKCIYLFLDDDICLVLLVSKSFRPRKVEWVKIGQIS